MCLFADRHNGLLILSKKPLLFSLKFDGFMSQDQIRAKYKGIIVAGMAAFCQFPLCLLS